ncbi:hypothetical protein TNCV_3865611 [Trichonephila clavipes]|nr:hypothetical protein TNCV_3865611 [Trichonephila clavipes]
MRNDEGGVVDPPLDIKRIIFSEIEIETRADCLAKKNKCEKTLFTCCPGRDGESEWILLKDLVMLSKCIGRTLFGEYRKGRRKKYAAVAQRLVCLRVPPQGCDSPEVKVSDRGRHVMSSSPVPLKTRHVGQRCTLNLSRAETSSRWCGS